MEDFSVYNGEGTTLRKVQLRVLEIFKVVDDIFQKNNITYWLDCGSLLGAVRHKGFIPWDDDIDICCMIEDVDRVRECLAKELPSDLIYVDWKNEKNYFDHCIRVKDLKGSKIICDRYKYQEHKGVYVDIFPVERIPSIPLKRLAETIYGRVFRQIHNYGLVIYKNEYKRIAIKSLSFILAPAAYGLVYFLRLWSKIVGGNLMAYTYGITCPKIPSKRLYNDIFPISEIVFEGISVKCPHNVNSYLKNIYGDYMTIPCKENRPTPYKVENI